MPSPMSAPSDDDPPLSNDDIETIYDIIRLAQTLPGRPYHALFDAYDRVRADPNKSGDPSRYFTFLVRMQDAATREGDDAEGLVERFQRELAKKGINVEVDPDGEGIEVTTALDMHGNALMGGNGAQFTQNTQNTQNNVEKGPSRRGSLDSFFDGSADKVAGVEYGELTHRSKGGSDAGDHLEPRRTGSDPVTRGPLPGHLPIRGRMNGNGHHRTPLYDVGGRPRRTASVSSYGSLRIYRDGYTGTQQLGDYAGNESEHTETTDSFDRSHIQIPGVNAPLPDLHDEPHDYGIPATSYHPSDATMVRDAETFVYHKNLALKRSYILQWRNKTRSRADTHRELESAAFSFNRNVLLKASLDSWRVALQTKRQDTETDRFFERLETRAEKARNLFLLTKAFTHWAKSAEDEVQRTSTARRHILRTKYFNAWREITAVNELKIQHFVLANFLAKWRNRTAAVREQSDMAVNLYENNLVYRLYWQWFWKFADRRAPILHRNRLASETIRKWAEIVSILKEREAWAAGQRDLQLLRRAFAKLKEKAASARTRDTQADEFRQSALVSSGFYALRTSSKLAPLQAQVVAKIDGRLVRSTFEAWHRDTQLSRKAKVVDRVRILNNTFTAWNDRLRIKAVQDRIDDRVQVECMYKWALASRVSLFQRVHDHRLKGSLFTLWRNKTENRENTLENAERRFHNFKRAQRLRFCLRQLENATVERRGKEFLADSTYGEKAKQRVFDTLLEKHEHLQKLDDWADKANWYVTTKNALKKWQQATDYARRNRRREAYAHVRRTVKLNLVRSTFSIWRDKSARFAEAKIDAKREDLHRVRRAGAVLLGQWADKTAEIRGLEDQAVELHNTKLLTQTLLLWTEKNRNVQTMLVDAGAFREESTGIAAAAYLKKLGWRVWTVKRQEETALALRERNFEKHVRAMVRFWWEQASERIALRHEAEGSPSPLRRNPYEDDDNGFNGGGGNDDGDDDDDNDGNDVGDAQATTPPRSSAQDSGADRQTFNSPGDETQRLESWTPFNENTLGLRDLDLSFTVSQQSRSRPPASASRFTSSRRPIPARPNTVPQTDPRPRGTARTTPRTRPGGLRRTQAQPSSVLRPSFPTPITEEGSSLGRDDRELDLGLGLDPSALDINNMDDLEIDADEPTFWTSTPMPPGPRHPHPHPHPHSHSRPHSRQPSSVSLRKAPVLEPTIATVGGNLGITSGTGKPGYLKTPSKRSVVRERSGVLPAPLTSPERLRNLGAQSAPPGVRFADGGVGGAGVGSFETRLREGGYVAPGTGTGRRKRVEFR